MKYCLHSTNNSQSVCENIQGTANIRQQLMLVLGDLYAPPEITDTARLPPRASAAPTKLSTIKLRRLGRHEEENKTYTPPIQTDIAQTNHITARSCDWCTYPHALRLRSLSTLELFCILCAYPAVFTPVVIC
jgi:hypothetical protein